jgi:hypothetical protein
MKVASGAIVSNPSFEKSIDERGGSQYLTQPVRDFAARHGIGNHLANAIALLESNFPTHTGLSVRVDTDPEESGEWIVIEVASNDELAPFLNAYNQCLAAWIEKLPANALELIRLSYSLT